MTKSKLHINNFEASKESGVIKTLLVGHDSINLHGGGVELGNWLGFFSQESSFGVECSFSRRELSISDELVTSIVEVRLPGSFFEVHIEERIEDGVWMRHVRIVALEDSILGDLVLRLGVLNSSFQYAKANNKIYKHRSRNSYFQYPVEVVELLGTKYSIKSEMLHYENMGRFPYFSYWRDQPDAKWIHHQRLLVSRNDYDDVVFRFGRRTYVSSNVSILKNKLICRPLWGLNENILSKLPFTRWPTIQAQGVINLVEGDSVSMNSKVSINFRENKFE